MLVSLLLLLLLASPVLAQTSAVPAPPDQIPFTLRSQSNLVLVPTQVQTRKGDMLYDLQPAQFTLLDDGVRQTIRLDEDPDAVGLNLVVVVQCSRSAFTQFGHMNGLPAMVDDLLGGAPHQIALINYGSEIELLTPFTRSDKRLAGAFSNLQPCDDEKDARTLDAVDYANKLFDKLPAANHDRRAILLIGETRDHGSETHTAVVAANLARSNTVVDAISFNPGKDDLLKMLPFGGPAPNPAEAILLLVNALRRNVPHTLTDMTGGEYSNFNSQKGFESGVHRLANHIHNYYLLSFQPAMADGSPVAPGVHRIQVKIPDYPDAKIRHRLTYYFGTAPPPDVPESAAPGPGPSETQIPNRLAAPHSAQPASSR